MRRIVRGVAAMGMLLAVLVPLSPIGPAAAHQPYCEEEDVDLHAPFTVKNPTVSTAFYATLFPADDIDYAVFHGEAGQRVLLGITIPQIAGQEDFAPTLALIGPALEPVDAEALPADLELPEGAGAVVVPAGDEPPEPFFEPFSRTSYWGRQEVRITLPETGRYTVAVWSPAAQPGRYVLVIGDREVMGGDIGCLMNLSDYFQPIDPDVEAERLKAAPHQHAEDDHHAPAASTPAAPTHESHRH